MDKFKT